MRCQLYGVAGGNGKATHFVLGPMTENEWYFREIGSGCEETEGYEMQAIGAELDLDESTEELARTDAKSFGEKLRTEGHPISLKYFARANLTYRPARRR